MDASISAEHIFNESIAIIITWIVCMRMNSIGATCVHWFAQLNQFLEKVIKIFGRYVQIVNANVVLFEKMRRILMNHVRGHRWIGHFQCHLLCHCCWYRYGDRRRSLWNSREWCRWNENGLCWVEIWNWGTIRGYVISVECVWADALMGNQQFQYLPTK